MTELKYDNPDNDPAYDEWFNNQVDKKLAPESVWDKVFGKPTGSFKKLSAVERRLKREED